MTRLVSLVLAAACALIAHATCLAEEFMSVRIVTLNVREGLGAPGEFSREQTGLFLTTNDLDGPGPNSGLNPDIVALQECRSTANLLAYRDDFLPGYQMVRSNVVDAGGNFQAFFLRPEYVVLDTDDYGIGGPRPMFRVTIEIPGAARSLTLYNVHYKAFGDQASINQRALTPTRPASRSGATACRASTSTTISSVRRPAATRSCSATSTPTTTSTARSTASSPT